MQLAFIQFFVQMSGHKIWNNKLHTPEGLKYAVATGQVRESALIVQRSMRAMTSRAACSVISLVCSGKKSGCNGTYGQVHF